MKPRRVQNETPEGRKSSPGGLRKPPRPKRRFGSLPRRLLERLRGPKKNLGCAQERLGKISGSFFTLPRVPGGSPRGSLRASGRVFWSSCSRLLLKSSFFQKVWFSYRKTMIFEGPRGLRGVIFRSHIALGSVPAALGVLPGLKIAPRTLQERPTTPQDRPGTARKRPKSLQKRPKGGPRAPRKCQDACYRFLVPVLESKMEAKSIFL